MRIAKRAVLATAAGVTLLFLAAAPAAAASTSGQDRAFLQQAHESNLAEIAAGRLAQSNGTDQSVKSLGARFVADHTRLDRELQQTATTLRVALPVTPTPQQQALFRQYQAASGKTFDTLFVTTQMNGHMQVMQLGETELAKGSAPQAKTAAAHAGPVVQAHEVLLNQSAQSLGIPNRVATGSGFVPTPR
jgi:putative membrane protein